MARAEATRLALDATRIQCSAVWDSVQFIANGVVFVLLGEQLPTILTAAQATVMQTGHHSLWWPPMLIAAIYDARLTLRFVWIWAGVILTRRDTGSNLLPPYDAPGDIAARTTVATTGFPHENKNVARPWLKERKAERIYILAVNSDQYGQSAS